MGAPFPLRQLDTASKMSAHADIVSLETIRNYVINWVRNPDPRGKFAKRMKWLQWLPDDVILFALRKMRYGGNVLFAEGKPIGHVFFQRHGDDLHMFSIAVVKHLQGLGWAKHQLEVFLNEALADRTVQRVRLSAGN